MKIYIGAEFFISYDCPIYPLFPYAHIGTLGGLFTWNRLEYSTLTLL